VRQGPPGSAHFSPYSDRVTHLFPRLETPPQTPPPPAPSEPATSDTPSPRDTDVAGAEPTTPSEMRPEPYTTAPTTSKPLNRPPSAIEAITLRLAQIAAEPGELWLVDRDGWDPWPAVICDECIVSRFFQNRWQQRVSSQRSDTTWGKKLAEYDKLVGKKTFPALLLALNKW